MKDKKEQAGERASKEYLQNLEQSSGLKVSELTINNFKLIGHVEIRPTGQIIMISGKNNQGKSTVFDAIMAALRGAKFVPDKPIKEGRHSGEIVCKLKSATDELTVVRTFTRKKDGSEDFTTSLTVTSPNKAITRHQEVLDKLLGTISLDPSEFIIMEPARRLKTLKQLVPLTDAKGKPLDADALDGQNKVDYETRKVLNREHDRLSAEASALLNQIPDGFALKEEIDIAELATRMQQASDHNAAINLVRSRRQDAITRAERNQTLALRKQEELKAALAQAVADEKRFQKELHGLRSEKDNPVIDTAELSASLSTAKETNRLIELRKKAVDLSEQSRTKMFAAEKLSQSIASRNLEKEDALRRAKFPIPGLAFGEDEVLYNDLPFSQASTSQQIRVGCAIAMSLRPEIRVLNIKHGNLLDDDTWAIVGEMAEDNKWQIWTELVSKEPVGITMVEGSIQP